MKVNEEAAKELKKLGSKDTKSAATKRDFDAVEKENKEEGGPHKKK